MCKNTNDVAHQSLALNQETRRRQNEFMATRNAPVPPSGPEMEPVVATQWEMPQITDEMIQNFDFSMYAHGGLPLGDALTLKSGLQPGPTGPATGQPGELSGQPVANRAPTGGARDPVCARSTGLLTGVSGAPPDRSPTGRQPEELLDDAKCLRSLVRSDQPLHRAIRSLVRLTGCSVELWEIILHGYREPQDPVRLTSTEFYNRQLNASARDKIRSGINRKLLDQVNDIGSAKELWDRIVVLQEGTDLIQSALYETAKQEAHQFMIREGESVADAYARLGALRVRVKGLGVEKYDDGFEMNEGFIKSKVIAMIVVKQEDTNLALNLQIMTKSADLNSDDLVSYVAANENMAKAGKRLMAMNRVDEASHNHEASHNLALKARADHGGEEEYEIEEDEEMTSTSDIATDFAFFAKKYKGKLPMLLNDKKKKRTCYNCDEESHFANECPYEKRVDKPKFIKGVKPRLKPNPINDRYKRNKGRAFVGAEYLSDEEEEDEEKEAGVAGLAFSKPGSLFTYDYSKDYSTENDVGSSFMARTTQDDDSDDSPSSTIVGSCLMARETKVMEPPPSLSSVLDDEAENQEELTVLKELYNVRCTLRGEALVKFDFLMDSLKEKDESIEELEYHLNDKERRFNLLRQELKTERCISQGLKQQIETYELDKVKDLETIERAQSLTQELNASKEELEVAHASLTRDLDHLERANKLVKDELKKLGKNHDLLQETYSKALESMNDSIVDKNVASSSTTFTSEHAKLVAEHVRLQEELSLHVETNTYLESLVTKYGLNYYPNESACEQATTLEENVRLKKELAKFTTTKNKMGLDDLLSKQRSNNQKYGLGYVPKPYKKNNYKKEKPAQEKNKKVTNDGKAPKGKATSGDRTGPNNHYALFVDYYGDVYANYVGPRNGYAYRGYSIWGYSSGGPKWVFDSGCTNHMTGGRGVLDQFIEDINKKSSITFGDNSKGKVLGSDNLKLVLVGYVENNLYVVDLSKESPSPSTCLMAAKHDEGWLWHRRLGHVNMRNLKQLLKGEHIVGLTDISFEKDRVCSACVAGKQLKKKHPIKSIVTTSRPLELLHLDLFGPSHYDTLGGSKYGLVIVDDYSRYSWVFLLKSKDETHREFITFAKKAQRTYESEIKAIRTDNGTEFKNYTMQEFVDDEGIKHEFSAPYTPQQNGVVERKNRTIIEMARTMLSEFNSPHNFWGEAISTAVHYSNRLFLRPLHNKTPYELLTGNKPNVMYIRVFGCKCLVKNNKGKLGKFETRTIEGIFVGYAENSHAYRYYNRSTGTIEVSCDVVFLEDNGSQVEQVVPCVAGNDDDPSSAIKHMGIGHIRPMEVHNDDQGDGVEVSSSPQVEPSSTQVEPSSATQDVSSTQDEPHPEEQEESPQPTEQDHDDDQETSSTHVQAQVVPHDQVLARDEFIDHEGTIRKIKAATRASDMKVDQVLGSISKGVVTRRHHALLITYCQHHAFVSSFEPLKVHEALVDPDWVIAMQEELECFTRNEVWSLVERPKDHRINVIGTKWVFKNKQDENGIVIRNKASVPRSCAPSPHFVCRCSPEFRRPVNLRRASAGPRRVESFCSVFFSRAAFVLLLDLHRLAVGRALRRPRACSFAGEGLPRQLRHSRPRTASPSLKPSGEEFAGSAPSTPSTQIPTFWKDLKMGKTPASRLGRSPPKPTGSADDLVMLEIHEHVPPLRAEAGTEFVDKLMAQGQKNKRSPSDDGSSQAPPLKRFLGGEESWRAPLRASRCQPLPGVNYSLITPEAIMAMKSPPGDESPLRQGAGGDLLSPEMGFAAAASLEVFRIVALGTGGFATGALSRRKVNAWGHTRGPGGRAARPRAGPRRPPPWLPRGPTSLGLRSSGSFVQK
ncbi:hypothetical protein QYE76_040168 [Lolium multiflorum]|uniref:Gag-pol polyprotein n=1 Tax=Lolium multiflorum TaxID=4521 RepID=A0AAD8WSU7_LOLMU|nr:hypothetical protein QYE76_040168 [Lolium multiflorum]